MRIFSGVFRLFLQHGQYLHKSCRRPNRSGVGAIDSPDRFEKVLDQRYIPEVSEKIFTHDISMIRRQKMVIFGVLKVFISNFTYYNLY